MRPNELLLIRRLPASQVIGTKLVRTMDGKRRNSTLISKAFIHIEIQLVKNTTNLYILSLGVQVQKKVDMLLTS